MVNSNHFCFVDSWAELSWQENLETQQYGPPDGEVQVGISSARHEVSDGRILRSTNQRNSAETVSKWRGESSIQIGLVFMTSSATASLGLWVWRRWHCACPAFAGSWRRARRGENQWASQFCGPIWSTSVPNDSAGIQGPTIGWIAFKTLGEAYFRWI